MRKRRLELDIAPHQRVVLGVRNLGRILGMIEPVMPRDRLRQSHQLVGGFGFGKVGLHHAYSSGLVSARVPKPAMIGRAFAMASCTDGSERLASWSAFERQTSVIQIESGSARSSATM